MQNFTNNYPVEEPEKTQSTMQRRSFLRYAGAGAAALSLFAVACKKSSDVTSTTKTSIDVGGGDNGVLNFAYVLTQIEAAFYTQVISTPYTSITTAETTILTDLRDHEIAHREFLKALLGTNAMAAITPDFSNINFNDRTNVLAAAKGIEDLGVAAYNGAAPFINTDPNNLGFILKIVSVEARHSAVIRNLLAGTTYATFADSTLIHGASYGSVADPLNGLETYRTPAQVLNALNQYLTVNLTATLLV